MSEVLDALGEMGFESKEAYQNSILEKIHKHLVNVQRLKNMIVDYKHPVFHDPEEWYKFYLKFIALPREQAGGTDESFEIYNRERAELILELLTIIHKEIGDEESRADLSYLSLFDRSSASIQKILDYLEAEAHGY